jgi:hypothetical protein
MDNIQRETVFYNRAALPHLRVQSPHPGKPSSHVS